MNKLGNAGNLSVNVTGAVSIAGDGSGLFSDTSASGLGGAIDLTASDVTIAPGGVISTTSQGTGNAGNISIMAGNSLTMQQGSIRTDAKVSDGGNIVIQANNMLNMDASRITTSVGSGEGNGGNIFIDPKFVILRNSQIQANAFGGAGGKIVIIAENFLASPDSIVSASSAKSVPGTVSISTSGTDIGGTLVVLPEALADAAMQLAEQCEARGGRTLASFVGTGRGGLPAGPEDPMPAYYQAGVSTGNVARSTARSTGADTDLIRFKAYARRIKEPGVADQTAVFPGTMALSCGV